MFADVMISVIIPTLNEASKVGKLIAFLQHQSQTVVDIIIADAGSLDETVKIAQDTGARVVYSPVQTRAAQMNLGAQVARGDILYFVHADVIPVESFCEDIYSAIQSGYEAGCYRFSFDSAHPLLKVNAYCTRYNGIMCRGGDQTLFITKKLFLTLKGFDEYYTIMEDYDLIRRIRSKALFRIIPKEVIVSARKYETNGWLRVQVAHLTVFILYFLKIHPDRIKLFYRKVLHQR